MKHLLTVLFCLSLLSSLSFAQEALSFPDMTGKNLLDEDFSLPSDFSSDYSIVLMPLEQDQQDHFGTWEAYLDELIAEQRNLDYYQVLPIGDMNFFLKGIISSAMKGAFSDTTKARTMPLFEEVEPLLAALNVTDTSEMVILLVKNESIVWRTQGIYSEASAAELEQALATNR